jgi:hypothetical protein
MPISPVDQYSFTFHPQLKYFCPTHNDCIFKLRRDSGLVQVPNFEIKNVVGNFKAEFS